MSKNTWITSYKPNPSAKIRLFCIPFAGGGASIFNTWINHLAPFIDVCPVQLPGRENRFTEPPITRIDILVEELLDALCPLFDLPAAFFGHSMGAFISFELVRTLCSVKPDIPQYLFVGGCRAPQIPGPSKHIHDLPSNLLIEEMRHLNGTPTEILRNEEFMELLIPIFRADLSLFEGYAYKQGPLLPLPISAFGGINDRRVTRSDLMGWEAQTSRRFSLRMLDGEHFFLIDSKKELLAEIQLALQRLPVDG